MLDLPPLQLNAHRTKQSPFSEFFAREGGFYVAKSVALINLEQRDSQL
jgi:hypothetical protein